MRFVEGLAIREIRRRTGLHRETIRRALSSSTPPGYSRAARGSKLDRFKDQVHELLREDPEIESQRIRELLIESGFEGGKTIVDDYVREVRPFFVDQRTFQRTVYRPGDVYAVRSVAAQAGNPGRLRPDAQGLRGRWRAWLLALRCWRVGVLQGGAGRAVGDAALRVADRRAARAAGGRPRGVSARRWRPPD